MKFSEIGSAVDTSDIDRPGALLGGVSVAVTFFVDQELPLPVTWAVTGRFESKDSKVRAEASSLGRHRESLGLPKLDQLLSMLYIEYSKSAIVMLFSGQKGS